MSKVKLDALTKRFGQTVAIEDLTLQCEDGEFVAMLGRPGAGKTTTLKIVAGVEEKSSGDVLFDDRSVSGVAPEKRNVAMAFESYALYPHWSVRDNLEFPLKAPGRNLDAPARTAQIKRVTDLLEISHLLDRKPVQLSGGQRQRVSLGRALVRQANITLLDEPIAHLDARLRNSLRGELKHYQRERGATTLYTTPDYSEASGVGDRIAVLIDGRIRQLSTPTEIYDAPADLDVALMVGDPKMNILRLPDQTGVLPIAGAAIPLPPRPHGVRYLGLRPTDLRISTEKVEGAIPARVYVTEPTGYDQVVRLEAGTELINVKVPLQDGTFTIDQRVWLVPDWRRVHLFDEEGKHIEGVQ